VVAVHATIWSVGSEAAVLDKLLYPVPHNAEGHKRYWIMNIFLSFETHLKYKNGFGRKILLGNQHLGQQHRLH
jgi:hypothetical protein